MISLKYLPSYNDNFTPSANSTNNFHASSSTSSSRLKSKLPRHVVKAIQAYHSEEKRKLRLSATNNAEDAHLVAAGTNSHHQSAHSPKTRVSNSLKSKPPVSTSTKSTRESQERDPHASTSSSHSITMDYITDIIYIQREELDARGANSTNHLTHSTAADSQQQPRKLLHIIETLTYVDASSHTLEELPQGTEQRLYWMIYDLNRKTLIHRRRIQLEKSAAPSSHNSSHTRIQVSNKKHQNIHHHLHSLEHSPSSIAKCFHVKDGKYLGIGTSTGQVYVLTCFERHHSQHAEAASRTSTPHLKSTTTHHQKQKVRQLTLNELGERYQVQMLQWCRDTLFAIVRLDHEQDHLMLFDLGLNILKIVLIPGARRESLLRMHCQIPEPQRSLDAYHIIRVHTMAHGEENHESIQQGELQANVSSGKNNMEELKRQLSHRDRRQEALDFKNSRRWRIDQMQFQDSAVDSLRNQTVNPTNDVIFQLTFDEGLSCCFRVHTSLLFFPKQLRLLSSTYILRLHLRQHQPKKVLSVIRNLSDTTELVRCLCILVEYLLKQYSSTQNTPTKHDGNKQKRSNHNGSLLDTILTKYAALFANDFHFQSLFQRYFTLCLRNDHFQKAFQIAFHLGHEELFATLYQCASEQNYPGIAHLALQHVSESFRNKVTMKYSVQQKLRRLQIRNNNRHSQKGGDGTEDSPRSTHASEFSLEDAISKYRSAVASHNLNQLTQEEKTLLAGFFETRGDIERALQLYPMKEQQERLSLLREKIR